MDPWLPWSWLLILMVAFVAAPLLIYRRSGKVEDPRWIGLLVGLRVVAVLVLLFLLARPVASVRNKVVEKAQLALLVDASRSMRTADMPGGQRRDHAVRAWFATHRELVASLGEKFKVELIAFGPDLREQPVTHEGVADATGIGPALRSFWERRRVGRVEAVVMFTDGNHNHGTAPIDAARQYAQGRVPIHAVMLGSERPTRSMRDLALVDLVAPAAVDLGNAFEVSLQLRALAAQGERARVVCLFAGRKVEERVVPIASNRQTTKLRFEVPTEAKGTFPLQVRVEPLTGERVTANNELRTDVRVTSRKVQVLLLEGAMRWEATFLRRTLAGDPAINLVLGYAGDPRLAARLREADRRRQFDVIIIGDVRADRVPPALVAALPQLIARRTNDAERGRGLLMTGGGLTLSAGGWADSQLAKLLPVELARTPSRVEGELPARPTHQGERHFALRFADDLATNAALWRAMPALLGADKPRRVKQSGTVLLRAGGDPLLVTAPYGLGRVAVLTSGSTWRWVMCEDPKVARRHRLFWRQLVLWLAKRDEESKGKMWLALRPGKSLFVRGEPAEVELHVVDGRWQPDPRAEVGLSLTAPDGGKTPLTPTWDTARGAFVAKLDLGAVGDYAVEGTARRGEDDLGRDRVALSVRKRAPLETADPFARPEIAARMAARTKGRVVELGQAAGLLRSLHERGKPTVHVMERQEDRWDRGWVLLLFALALGAEWVLRKVRGLI